MSVLNSVYKPPPTHTDRDSILASVILLLLVLLEHLFVYNITAPEEQILYQSTATCATDYGGTNEWIDVAEAPGHAPRERLPLLDRCLSRRARRARHAKGGKSASEIRIGR